MTSPLSALLLGTGLLLAGTPCALAASPGGPGGGGKHDGVTAAKPDLHPDAVTTTGTVTAGGHPIAYQAIAGTLVVHPKDADDADTEAGDADNPTEPDITGTADAKSGTGGADKKSRTAEAAMFYVAYLATGTHGTPRPVTFVYNGGPGSSSVWLHMGAFGPRRVVTPDDTHGTGAPYELVNNDETLLDATDLVFVDAPGTGFGHLAGPDKEKAFLGVDQDANAFANFITAFLTRYGRWNAPRYVFGESYGTTRSAVLANILEQDKGIDLNGVILLSQILNFDLSPDGAEDNPGVDLPYVLALPTYAATAWYHHRLGANPPPLDQLLPEVEHYATHDYLAALTEGSALDGATRDQVASKLSAYTGLPVDYLKRANLRVEGGEFEHALLADDDTTTGRLDSRFKGPSMDPLSKEADYDPQGAAIGSAYVSAFNDYVRTTLHYGADRTYKAYVDYDKVWDDKHKQPGSDDTSNGTPNVMPDLAAAMKYDPMLRVQLNQGFYDIATPFFEGVYEMQHLPIPPSLRGNIEIHQYQSGHMVYAHIPALHELHDNVAAFIRRTSGH